MLCTCVVNSVGPLSNNDISIYISPDSLLDTPTNPFFIVLVLSDVKNQFSGQWFFADSGAENYMLAVGLAAISTGNHVTADVDWPHPVVGRGQDGSTVYAVPYCHLLQISAD